MSKTSINLSVSILIFLAVTISWLMFLSLVGSKENATMVIEAKAAQENLQNANNLSATTLFEDTAPKPINFLGTLLRLLMLQMSCSP